MKVFLKAPSSLSIVRKCRVRYSVKGNIFSFRVSKVDIGSKYFARVFNSYRFCFQAVGNSLISYVKVFLIWISKEFSQLRMRLYNIRSFKYGKVCKGTDLLLISQYSLRICLRLLIGQNQFFSRQWCFREPFWLNIELTSYVLMQESQQSQIFQVSRFCLIQISRNYCRSPSAQISYQCSSLALNSYSLKRSFLANKTVILST